MNKHSKSASEEKGLHPRNLHRARYDLKRLCQSVPELEEFLYKTPSGEDSVRFSDPAAVKYLNQALLKQYYSIEYWDLPEGYLTPPIPGRADYIHYLADLLSDEGGGEIPQGKNVRVLDIGVGANCIYPILGRQCYGWSFVGSDVNPTSAALSEQIVKTNQLLRKNVVIRQQQQRTNIFTGVIRADDYFDLTMCNPPFHASAAEADRVAQRKRNNLARNALNRAEGRQLNFGGQASELWCKGGEFAFVRQMIRESVDFAKQCLWFTCLISKKDNLRGLKSELHRAGVKAQKVIKMSQGQKQSRFLAWSFLSDEQRKEWVEQRR